MNPTAIGRGCESFTSTRNVFTDLTNQCSTPRVTSVISSNFGLGANTITPFPNVSTINDETVLECSTPLELTNSEDSICEVIDTDSSQNAHLIVINSDSGNVLQSTAINHRLENYVYQLLMTKDEGPFLIYLYDFESNSENYKKLIETKKRSYFSTRVVSKIIIFHEIHRTNDFYISSRRFDELAETAAQLFPRYLKETFYVKPTKTSNAHGSLHNAYVGIREKAISTNFIKPITSHKRKVTEENNIFSNVEELMIDVEILDDAYVQEWKNTSSDDKITFFKNNDLNTILKKFPNLTKPVGYILIQADFLVLFSKPDHLLQQNWPSIASKIIQLSENKKNHEKSIRDILRDNQSALKGNSELVALYLLPFLFKKNCKTNEAL